MFDTSSDNSRVISLPEPDHIGSASVEQAILERRSVRKYKKEPLELSALSQLLWAAQGITNPKGWRTAPSAGALYPLELYAAAGNVNGLSPGVYKYIPTRHALTHIMDDDKRPALTAAALNQTFISAAPVTIVFSAVINRTTRIYGERGIKYVFMDTGHACQNVHLQAVSLGLGTVVVGAFRDDDIKRILQMPKEEYPVALMPVGKL